jgi:beta-ureidopropionase / N-carbamoyl-L-amino-acid hydrolase
VITLEQLNALPAAEFVAILGGIFEHSPWVAQRAAAARPFASRLQLLDSMRAAVDAATREEQLALIRAHPQLGARGRSLSQLTVASAREQRRAGLNACTPADGVRLEQLNAHYLERFGFPFILAVRGHDPASILANFERRLSNDNNREQRVALSQIGAIAAYRLADVIAAPPGAEIVAMLERLARSSEPPAAAVLGGAAGGSRSATDLVREWMQAAGFEVFMVTGGYLIGRTAGGESSTKTLLAGVCRDPLVNAARYEGRAAFVVAIEVAQQLRQKGADLSFALAVMARPDDARVGDAGGLLDGQASPAWVELTDVDAPDADAEGLEIFRALRAVDLGETVITLARQANAAAGQRAVAAFTAGAAEQAAMALEASLWRVQTAA